MGKALGKPDIMEGTKKFLLQILFGIIIIIIISIMFIVIIISIIIIVLIIILAGFYNFVICVKIFCRI